VRPGAAAPERGQGVEVGGPGGDILRARKHEHGKVRLFGEETLGALAVERGGNQLEPDERQAGHKDSGKIARGQAGELGALRRFRARPATAKDAPGGARIAECRN
jgi:hypothetical protein